MVARELGPRAVVPINLLLIGHDFASPLQIPLAVPTSGIDDSSVQVRALGSLEIDLRSFVDAWIEPGLTYVWAWSSEQRQQVTFTGVEPGRVPRREIRRGPLDL